MLLKDLSPNNALPQTVLRLLGLSLVLMVQGCSPLGEPVDPEKSNYHYYNNSKTEIRYSPMGNWFELGNSYIPADVESFSVFSKWLSKDKNQLFFESFPVENNIIDHATFYAKDDLYHADIGFDKDFAYAFVKTYKNKKTQVMAKVIEGANPQTYVRTDGTWANDGTHHYYNNNRLNVDFDSFRTLNDFFAKDKAKTYVRNDSTFTAFESDITSLAILENSNHAIDHKMVYWLPFFTKESANLIAIPYNDKRDVKFLNRYFLKIANTIYYDGSARKDIEAKSFEIIDHSYAKDATNVYYKDQIIPHADAASFGKKENSYLYEDKNATYVKGRMKEKKSTGQH